MDDEDWTTEWPNEVGSFWFYGFRYGKISSLQEPELLHVKVKKIMNGYAYYSDGEFIWKDKAGKAYFKKVELPKLPKQ